MLSYQNRLNQKEDITNDLERDAFYFRGKHYFGDDGMQNYFVFQPMYFKKIIDSTDNTVYVHCWQSKRLSDENLIAPGTNSNNDQAPLIQYHNTRICLQFSGGSLKQNKVTYSHGRTVNIHNAYRLSPHTASTDFTIKNGLFGAIKLIKNNDKDEYQYSQYGICFDSRGSFTHPDGSYGVNAVIFGWICQAVFIQIIEKIVF